MANPSTFLFTFWCLQCFVALVQAQQILKASLTATSLNPSVPLTSFTPSPSAGPPGHPPSSLIGQATKTSTFTPQELVLSGTYYHEAPNPAVTPSLIRNETIAHAATSALTHLDGTKTVTHSRRPQNTQPCNLHVEFCGRSYGNITYVGTHNSPFIRENSAAANQHLDVTTQLDDGVRMRMYISLHLKISSKFPKIWISVQGQTHMENGTLYLCHTK